MRFLFNTAPNHDSLKEWFKVKTINDAFRWHQVFTPWFNKNEIVEILKLYMDSD
jgi:hypothetical protein